LSGGRHPAAHSITGSGAAGALGADTRGGLRAIRCPPDLSLRSCQARGNALVGRPDAAADSLANLIDLRLNETIYWLTVVATIFLPLTFITGFFGMNFTWMVDRIDTALAFWLLGIGAPVLAAVITGLLVRRRRTPIEPDHG
jgi:hypothetical protein